MANLKNFADLKSLSAQLKAESEKKREKALREEEMRKAAAEANIFRTAYPALPRYVQCNVTYRKLNALPTAVSAYR
jgi:hypothetical protein